MRDGAAPFLSSSAAPNRLRIDPRPDGSPWPADVTSLAQALAEAEQPLAAY
jgi:hypothetical protein